MEYGITCNIYILFLCFLVKILEIFIYFYVLDDFWYTEVCMVSENVNEVR